MVKTGRGPLSIPKGGWGYQGLEFNQNWAGSFKWSHHCRPGCTLQPFFQKDFWRVSDLIKSTFPHLKNPNFIGGAKAVFDGPQNPKGPLLIPFKIKDGINHVL